MNNDLFLDENIPSPLSENEFLTYYQEMQQGDKESRGIIINHNIRLVLDRVVKRFNNTNIDKKDLVSIGLIGLMKAIDTFDIKKGIKFSTYATTCIDNEILMTIRKYRKYLKNLSLDYAIMDDDGADILFKDTILDSFDFTLDYEKKETLEILKKLVLELNDRDKEIIMLYFGFYDDRCYNQKEIAKIFNITQSVVSRIIKRILKTLYLQLNNQENLQKIPG